MGSTSKEIEALEQDDIANNNSTGQEPPKSQMFRLGIVPFDPLFVWVAVIYGFTRVLELALGSEGFWQRLWVGFVDYCDTDEYTFVVLVMSAIPLGCYWLVSLSFLAADLTGSLRKYKVQPGKNEPIETRKLIEAFVTVVFNQIFMSIAFSNMSFWMSRVILGERDVRLVPNFLPMMRDLLISYQIFDVAFYFFHRIMHSKYLYKNIHKIHHEWKAPIGIMAIYAHPTEHFFTNLIPTILGPVVTVADPVLILMWVTMVAITTVTDHSGYHLPFLKSPEFHDNHHVSFTECFGTSGLMDFIFRTDVKFRRSINFKRHRVLLSLKSTVSEFYPKVKKGVKAE